MQFGGEHAAVADAASAGQLAAVAPVEARAGVERAGGAARAAQAALQRLVRRTSRAARAAAATRAALDRRRREHVLDRVHVHVDHHVHADHHVERATIRSEDRPPTVALGGVVGRRPQVRSCATQRHPVRGPLLVVRGHCSFACCVRQCDLLNKNLINSLRLESDCAFWAFKSFSCECIFHFVQFYLYCTV